MVTGVLLVLIVLSLWGVSMQLKTIIETLFEMRDLLDRGRDDDDYNG